MYCAPSSITLDPTCLYSGSLAKATKQSLATNDNFNLQIQKLTLY